MEKKDSQRMQSVTSSTCSSYPPQLAAERRAAGAVGAASPPHHNGDVKIRQVVMQRITHIPILRAALVTC